MFKQSHPGQSTLRSTAAAIVIALISISTLAPGPAFARISGPVGDTFSAGCLTLQNKGDALIAEYKNASNERREQILAELRSNGTTWRQIGCQAVFGDISRIVLPGKRKIPMDAVVVGGDLLQAR